MVRKILLLLVLPVLIFGGNLTYKDGLIKAHTVVFGDSSIDPAVNNIKANLFINGDNLETLHGTISFNIANFTSSNNDRDKHMQVMFEMEKYGNILLDIKSVQQDANAYIINGVFSMHGINKAVTIKSIIKKDSNILTLNANFFVKVSDYGMEPPSMLFFTVRDKVDVNASLKFQFN